MPSKEDMAQAYIEQVKNKIAELTAQLDALNKHVEECQSELEDNSEEKENEENELDAIFTSTTKN